MRKFSVIAGRDRLLATNAERSYVSQKRLTDFSTSVRFGGADSLLLLLLL